jgi:endoglucanase
MKVTYTRWIVVFVSLFLLHSISMAADAIWPQPMRGVTVNLHLDEAGFKNLSENWKANSVRLMLMSGDIRHPEAPYSIQEHQLKKIDAFLALCKKYNLRCILDVHETPGRVEWGGEKDRRMWDSYEFHEYLEETWETLAQRYRDYGDVIAGYDLFNEPNMDEQKAGTPSDWNAQARKLTAAIRKYDTVHPIIVEPIQWGSASGFDHLEPTGDANTIYSFHFYIPHQFTHQGVQDTEAGPFSYPGVIHDKEWNKEELEKAMAPAIAFQKKHNCEIYVGEFSVIRWAPGDSGLQYLRDTVSLFEKYGWSWSYHAYREWAGWSLEHEGPRDKTAGPLATTPRLELMKSFWAKN